MTTPNSVDVAIIGAGTAGMAAYRQSVKETDNVLLIEGNAFGTTCARSGCMPSKMLIAAANVAHSGKETAQFGIHFKAPRVDGVAVMQRLKSLRDTYVASVVETVTGWPEHHRVLAHAAFVGPDRLRLTPLDDAPAYDVIAKRVVIATGASPVVPEPFQSLPEVITSDDVFDWDDLPKSVLVFGAGVVGLELGQALDRLGVRTVLLGKNDDIGQITDPNVRDVALSVIKGQMPFHPDHELDSLTSAEGGGLRAKWRSSQGGGDEVFEKVLVAVGRAPNLSGLNLAVTGLSLSEAGLPEFDETTGRCGDSTIFIAGDANARIPLLHIAAREGKTSGTNAAVLPETRPSKALAKLSITFCDPQIAIAGQSFKDLCDAGVAFACGQIDWRAQGRATVMGTNCGLTRLYGESGTGRLLGAEMFGPDTEHLAHLIAWEIETGATVTELLDRPFYHPCLQEGLRTALRDLAGNLGLLDEEPVPNCLDCGPGA